MGFQISNLRFGIEPGVGAGCELVEETNQGFISFRRSRSSKDGGCISNCFRSFMKKLTAEQFEEYAADPLGTDERVRK